MSWTLGDSVAVIGPILPAVGVGIGVSIRSGYRAVIARIDHTETRIMGRLDQVEQEQTHQGRVLANHGERLAWIEGSQGRPLGSTTHPREGVDATVR